jgi:hypothetical protein
MYGVICGVGGLGVGGAIFGSVAASGDPGAGIFMGGVIGLLSFLISRSAVDEYSKKRQGKTRALLEALGAQARELAKPPKK